MKTAMKPNDVMRAKLKLLVDSSDSKKKALSAKLGYKQQGAFSKLLSGTAKIKPAHIQVITDFFGVSKEWFMDGSLDTRPVTLNTPAEINKKALIDLYIANMGMDQALQMFMRYAGEFLANSAHELRTEHPVVPAVTGPRAKDFKDGANGMDGKKTREG